MDTGDMALITRLTQLEERYNMTVSGLVTRVQALEEDKKQREADAQAREQVAAREFRVRAEKAEAALAELRDAEDGA